MPYAFRIFQHVTLHLGICHEIFIQFILVGAIAIPPCPWTWKPLQAAASSGRVFIVLGHPKWFWYHGDDGIAAILWPNKGTSRINLRDFGVLHFLTKTHWEIMCLKYAKQNTNSKQPSVTLAHVHWQRCTDWTFAQFQLHHGLYEGFVWTYGDYFQVVAIFIWKNEAASCYPTIWRFPRIEVPRNHPF